jgi:catechol 2,3-dioxygenase-like lactoylglutathione lyase family enzyme
MNAQRSELGAALDHICVESGDPDRLTQFLEVAYAMTRRPIAGGWRCQGPDRELLVVRGRANHVAYFAYAFDTDEALVSHRRALEAKDVALEPNPSPLFGDAAFAATDPDGNVVAFGARRTPDVATPETLPARLQHLAFRTPDVESLVRFYSDLGFVVSDRVEDDAGELRACFLRTDREHHALALFGSPESRLDHISCETRDIGAIVAWADRMSGNGIAIHWGVGRHGPGNDVFFMVKDPDDNLIEISADLEICDAARPMGRWRHEPRTLNLWGTAIMRS